jgi:hypothetical protein
VLIFANTDQHDMVQLLMTKDKITALERPIGDFVENIMNPGDSDAAVPPDSRGLSVGQQEKQEMMATVDESDCLHKIQTTGCSSAQRNRNSDTQG